MRKNRRGLLIGILCGVLLLPAVSMADSITPDTFSATLAVGESVTINKTVEITPEVTSALVDVFFLTDSTGSMGGLINSVKASASEILADTSGLGDVAFGVGEYRDIYDTFTYRMNTDITTDTTAAQSGINSWFASGGGDWYEANLFALQEVATGASWREGSTRIIVWFGDAPGHDPRAGATEESAIAALNSENITVEALNVGGLNGLDLEGQATRITAATDGAYFASVNTGAIVAAISDAITDVFAEYSEVSLSLADVPTGVTVTTAPESYIGDFDRSVARSFSFDVTFTADTPGTYSFPIYATVDGGIVAREFDTITGGGPAPVPEPSTIFLMGTGLLGLVVVGRKKINKKG